MKKLILIVLIFVVFFWIQYFHNPWKENLFWKEFEKGLIKNDFTNSEIKDIENIFQEAIKENDNDNFINTEKENNKKCLEWEKEYSKILKIALKIGKTMRCPLRVKN